MQKEHPPAASWDLGDSDHDSGNFTTPSSPFTILSMYFSLTCYVSITFISELIDTLCNVAREIWCNSSACCQDIIVTNLSQISRLNKKHNTIFRAFSTPRKHPASQNLEFGSFQPASLSFHVVPEMGKA